MTAARRSQALFERAREVIPGGVNSPVRAFGAVGGTPRFFTRGQGPYLEDVDGNRYVDLVCSWGPLIAGHAHPRVVAAVQAATARGTSFGAPTEPRWCWPRRWPGGSRRSGSCVWSAPAPRPP